MNPYNPNDAAPYAFVYRDDPEHCDGPLEECSRCGFPAPLRDFAYRRGAEPIYLCCLCANTSPATGVIGGPAIQRTICHAANAILSALGAFVEEPD